MALVKKDRHANDIEKKSNKNTNKNIDVAKATSVPGGAVENQEKINTGAFQIDKNVKET